MTKKANPTYLGYEFADNASSFNNIDKIRITTPTPNYETDSVNPFKQHNLAPLNNEQKKKKLAEFVSTLSNPDDKVRESYLEKLTELNTKKPASESEIYSSLTNITGEKIDPPYITNMSDLGKKLIGISYIFKPGTKFWE